MEVVVCKGNFAGLPPKQTPFLRVDAWPVNFGLLPRKREDQEAAEKVERGKRFFCVLMPGRSIPVRLRKREDRETAEKVERGRRLSMC